MFALAMMGLLAVVALRAADDERRSERALRESGVALYADEAGLRGTLGAWPTTAVKALKPGDSLSLGWQLLPNRASYGVVIHRVDNGGLQQYAIVVQAIGAGLLGGRSTLVQMVSAVSIFKWGMFSQNGIVMGGSGGLSDGYNSKRAPYSAATADSTGSLATNGSVVLNNGSSVVKGDVAAVGTATGTGGVTGTVTQSAAPFPTMPVLACPAGGYTPRVPAGTAVTYDPASGKVTVGGGHNLTLTAPPTQYHFSSVTLSGGSTLTINSGGQHVDIYIDDGLTIGGGGIGNTSGLPTMLGLWACGSPVKPTKWDLSGGSTGYFSVYAPNHDVVVGGGGDLFGAVVGSTITASGGSRLHYDEALAQQPSNLLTAVTGSWGQLGAK